MRILLCLFMVGISAFNELQAQESIENQDQPTTVIYHNPVSRTQLNHWMMLGPIPIQETVNELMEKGKFNPDDNLEEPNIFLSDGSVWLGWDYYTEAMRNSLLVDDGDELDSNPEIGKKQTIGGQEFEWSVHLFDRRFVNLDDLYGRHENAIVYAHAAIEMEETKTVHFYLRSDDSMKMWINGEEVYSFLGGRGVNQGEDKVEVELNQGINTVLLKVMNLHLDWGFGVQVRDLNDVSMEEAIEGSLEGAIESIFADASVIWIPVGLFIMGFIILLTLFFVIRSKFGSGDRLHG